MGWTYCSSAVYDGFMIDLHCDTILRLYSEKPDGNLLDTDCSVSIRQLEKIKALAQCFAIYTPPGDGRWQTMKNLYQRFCLETERNSSFIRRISSPDELGSGPEPAAILTIEDMGPVDGDEKRLDEVLSWHPLICSLIWNNENEYAYPNSQDAEIMNAPLKPAGEALACRLNENNIVIDVSHLSDGGFWNLCSLGVKIAATHSNCRELCPHPRNLTDEMIRAIADRGGVIGLNFCPIFLRGDDTSRIEDMVCHVKHMLNAGGEDVIALGTDFDGIEGKLEIAGTGQLPLLLQALRKEGLRESVIEKFWYRNALNFLKR